MPEVRILDCRRLDKRCERAALAKARSGSGHEGLRPSESVVPASRRRRSRRKPGRLLIRPIFRVRMAEIEKLQRAFKQVIDFFLAYLMRGQKFVQVEVRETAVGHPRGQ